ncbi:hypothetical protein [Streptomyces sp. NPDC088246]
MREELADLADRESATVAAVAVVLQRIKVHGADSHPGRSGRPDASPCATP